MKSSAMINSNFIVKHLTLFVVLSLLACIFPRSFAFQMSRVETFSKAFNDVVEGYYLIKNKLSFDFLVADGACNEFASDIISNVIKANAREIGPTTVTAIEESKTDEIDEIDEIILSRSTIIFIDQEWPNEKFSAVA